MSIYTASPFSKYMLGIFRIVAGLIFLSAGTMKVFGFPHNSMMPHFHFPSQIGIAGILETLGGLAIVLGFLTRPVSFVLAGEMAVAYFQFHAPKSFWPAINGGIPAILYCFLFLYLMFAGAGAWSIDGAIACSKKSSS
jgi:putative oxidoreductase